MGYEYDPPMISREEAARMRSVVRRNYELSEDGCSKRSADGPDAGSSSLFGSGAGKGGGDEKKKRKPKDEMDEVEDSVLAIVNKKEAELKEDPEFKFRRKPQPMKARAQGNTAIFKEVEKKKEKESDIDMRKAQKYMIKAHDERIQRWDMVGLVMVMYTAVVTPFDVSYLQPQLDALFVLNRIVDIYFLCDMILQFFLMPQDENGRYIKNQREVAMRYLKGWFIIDFVSVLPFDVIGMAADSDDASQLKVLRVIRVARLLKLLRIIRVNRVFRRWENMYSINYSVFGLYCYIAFVFASTHWFGCFYHLVTNIEDAGTNWVKSQFDVCADVTVNNATVTQCEGGSPDEVYVASLHWATQTISSIGYGSELAQTTAERAFVTLFMFIGGVIFAFALGEICGAVASLEVKEHAYHSIIDDFNNFAEEVELPQLLRTKCRQFFKHKHSNNTLKETEVGDILAQMTNHLRMEVALYIHTDWIKEIPFFKGCPEDFVVHLAVSMNIRTYTPKEAIYCPGDNADDMYVVKKGMVASKGVIYGSGKVFGVDMLHGMVHRPVERTAGCRSIAFTDLYQLPYDKFQQTCKVYPHVIPRVRSVAVKIMFISHILAFSKACMNFASGMTGFTNDLLILEMEEELKNKKLRTKKAKSNKFANVRDGYSKELRKMNKLMDNMKRAISKVEKAKSLPHVHS